MVGGVGVGDARRPDPAMVDDDALGRGKQRSEPLVEAGEIGAVTTARRDQGVDSATRFGEGSGRDYPAPGGGNPSLAADRLELVGVDPAPFGDEPVDRAVRLRLGDGQHGVDVEDLAAGHRGRPAGVPQHQAVARYERYRATEPEPGG